MGKSETANASIGIKILLSDLISQITENNLDFVKEMLEGGFIEDDNDFFNDEYQNIVNNIETEDHLEFKERLKTELEASYNDLLDKALLVPIKEILSNDRWGYNRWGINSASRPLDFDLSIDLERYEKLDKYEKVFILSQNAE